MLSLVKFKVAVVTTCCLAASYVVVIWAPLNIMPPPFHLGALSVVLVVGVLFSPLLGRRGDYGMLWTALSVQGIMVCSTTIVSLGVTLLFGQLPSDLESVGALLLMLFQASMFVYALALEQLSVFLFCIFVLHIATWYFRAFKRSPPKPEQ
ncbi:hypothetical protein [Polycladidibacter stylochi]|uniref:hypothetical protein n=1 Tax=Polycladidibacter stylochi TaxID=1807766 RepID=UPI00082FE6E8|nr:hypothetical protein [Pseudovibrio stylochi]